MLPSRLAVYAVTTTLGFDVRYVMTEVDPPSKTYDLTVPPGTYEVVARLDSDPLSGAGNLQCYSDQCSPVMTRAGFLNCQSPACQPELVDVLVEPSQSVTHVDVGGWGSLNALALLWRLDEFGAPGPIAYQRPTPNVTPSARPVLPLRDLPQTSTEVLPTEFDLKADYSRAVMARLHLPAGWHAIAKPARSELIDPAQDFTNREAMSPLALGVDGIWVTAAVFADWACASPATPDGTARANLGVADLYFEDPHSPVGIQPYSGYSVMVIKHLASCLVMRFTTSTADLREANLPMILAIVQSAE